MINFFSRKRFLVDYLGDFVDIHNHILPGIDDGAKTVEDSLNLIRGMGELGISRFIATPHIMRNYYPNTPETISGALDELRTALSEHNLVDVTINAAAEHMIDDYYENLLEEDGIMPLNKDYLLVEMSYLQASINLDSAIEKTTQRGFFPILAHPERYLYHMDNLELISALKEKGTLMQLNLLSLGDYYGVQTQQYAFQLLHSGLLDFTATDIHHAGQIEDLKKIHVPQKILEKLFPLIENTIARFY